MRCSPFILLSALSAITSLSCGAGSARESEMRAGPETGVESWTTRRARGLVRLVREQQATTGAPAAKRGHVSASFLAVASGVSPRPPTGKCLRGSAPAEVSHESVDAGELRVEDPGRRGQGIPVRPSELHHYSSALGPELLVDGASVALVVDGGAFPAFEHQVTWPSWASADTLTARRTADGGLALAWSAARDHQALLVSILASVDDPRELATCSLNADSGEAAIDKSVLDAMGAFIDAGRVLRATFIRDYEARAGDAQVLIELQDTRDLAIEEDSVKPQP